MLNLTKPKPLIQGWVG